MSAKAGIRLVGEIEPKSAAGVRTIPVLAILRDYLDAHLLRTERTGKDRIFGRSANQPFYAATIDGRAKRAWLAHNMAEREAAEKEGRAPVLLTLLTMHECRHTFASILIETGANPKAIQEVMGTRKSRPPLTSMGISCQAAMTTFGRAWMPSWRPANVCPLAEIRPTG
jgi:integrase